MKADDSALSQLLFLIDTAYDHVSWHGPNLRGSLRGVTPAQAAWRPAPGRHNIWELAVHAAYWKYVAWRRLTGAKRGSFPLSGSNFIARPQETTARAWAADVNLLEDMHRQLREAVAALGPGELDRPSAPRLPERLGGVPQRLPERLGGVPQRLPERLGGVPQRGVTRRALVTGIAAHDLYHAGQIQLLKRLRGRA